MESYKNTNELIEDLKPELQRLSSFYNEMLHINPYYNKSYNDIKVKIARLEATKVMIG